MWSVASKHYLESVCTSVWLINSTSEYSNRLFFLSFFFFCKVKSLVSIQCYWKSTKFGISRFGFKAYLTLTICVILGSLLAVTDTVCPQPDPPSWARAAILCCSECEVLMGSSSPLFVQGQEELLAQEVMPQLPISTQGSLQPMTALAWGGKDQQHLCPKVEPTEWSQAPDLPVVSMLSYWDHVLAWLFPYFLLLSSLPFWKPSSRTSLNRKPM